MWVRISPPIPRGDLSVTALFTAGTWAWADWPNAGLYHTRATHRVFKGVQAVMGVAGRVAGRPSTLVADLLHRHAVLDKLVRDAGHRQVVEVAAGLSPRGATFSEDAAYAWVEVDLPAVVAYKDALLAQTPEGQAVAARPNLRRVAGDARALVLADLVSNPAPTFVITEGLLMYLSADDQRAYFRRVAAGLAEHGGTLAFDLLPGAHQPDAGWVGKMLGAWMERFTGGAGFVEDDRTCEDVLADLRAAGFDTVRCIEPCLVAEAWGLPLPDVASSQRVFVAERQGSA